MPLGQKREGGGVYNFCLGHFNDDLGLVPPAPVPPMAMHRRDVQHKLCNREEHTPITILFEIITFIIRKPLNHVAVIAENSRGFPREASTLIFKIRSCAVRSDLKNMPEISRKCLVFKIHSCNARSDLESKSARFSGS